MSNIDLIKKRIVYRSEHRGIKEMDLLLKKFVKSYMNEFNLDELKQLDKLISLNDDELFKWYLHRDCEIKIPKNRVSNLLRRFKIK